MFYVHKYIICSGNTLLIKYGILFIFYFPFFEIVFRAVVENDERFVEKTYSEKCRAEYFQTGSTLFSEIWIHW